MTEEIDISDILNKFKKELFHFAINNPNIKNVGFRFEFYDANKLIEGRKVDVMMLDKHLEKLDKKLNQDNEDDIEIKTISETIVEEKEIIRGRPLNKEEMKCKQRRISEKAREVTKKHEIKTKTTFQNVTETFRHYITGNSLKKCYIKGIKFHITSRSEESKLAHLRAEVLGNDKVLLHVSVLSGEDNLKIFDQIMRDFHKFRIKCRHCGHTMGVDINKPEDKYDNSTVEDKLKSWFN